MSALLRWWMFITVLIGCAVAGLSYPTLYGDTGLVLVPTADIMPTGNFSLAVNVSREDLTSGTATVIPVRVTYGASDRTEFSLFFSEPTDKSEGGFDATGGGVKLSLLPENVERRTPGIAVGGRIASLRDPVGYDVIEGYAVFSKALLQSGDLEDKGFVFRFHGGVSYIQYSGAVDAEFFSPFFGVSYASVEGNSLVIDYVPKQEKGITTYRESTISGALRRRLSPNFWIELGSTKPFGQGGENSYYAGLLYHYGEIDRHADDAKVLVF
ncbi:MAG TPA: hypothetical protein VGM23_03140 [Armatimonadota bacterium]|jgi:hypothetical protein